VKIIPEPSKTRDTCSRSFGQILSAHLAYFALPQWTLGPAQQLGHSSVTTDLVYFTARPHCSQIRNAERCISSRDCVCHSVCPSVTFRYCVQMNEDTIVRFSASGRTISLVSGEVKFIRIFAGDHLQRGRLNEALSCRIVDSENLTNNRPRP